MPRVSYEGEIGKGEEDEDCSGKEKEPLCVYMMDRVKGVSQLDFILEHNTDGRDNTPEWFSWRKNLITDVARYARRLCSPDLACANSKRYRSRE